MKIIRISTENQVSVHDYPVGRISEQNRVLRSLIGEDCDLYEHVRPQRLYKNLKAPQDTSMLVDEEGLVKGLPVNGVASFLYGGVIAGNVLIIGETKDEYGEMEFCGLTDITLNFLLLPQIDRLAEVVKNAR